MNPGGPRGPIDIRPPRIPLRLLRGLVLPVIAIILVFSSVYTVGPEQVGVVQRFGRYVRTTDPGLQFRIPLGIELVTKVPVQRQLKAEFGFRTTTSAVRSEFTTAGFDAEANMLTGDLNAAQVEWVVQYRVVDPYKFLFRVRNVQETFRDMSEAVMQKVVGDRTVNEVLTVGREEIADLAEQQLQDLCNRYDTGLKVEQVVLQDVNPPDPVKPSFNEVNQAQQEREKLINEAQSEYNRVVPRAEGEALKAIQEAEGYALDRVNRAQGDSARFVTLFEAYRTAPEVTRKRIYLETMNDVLPKVSRKIVVDEDLKGLLPLLNLDGSTTPRKEAP